MRPALDSPERSGARGPRFALYACATLVALLLVAEAALRESADTHRASAVTGIALLLCGLLASRRLRLVERTLYREAQSYIDLAGAILIKVDTSYCVSMANPRACEVFGRTEDEVRGQSFQDLIATGLSRERSARRFQAIMAGEAVAEGELVRRTVVRPDATTREVEWQLVVSRDERGDITGLLVSGEDITDALHREDELARDLDDVRRLRELTQIIATTADARPAVVSSAAALLDVEVVSLARRTAVDPDAAVDAGSGSGSGSGSGEHEWTITHSSSPERVGQTVDPAAVAVTVEIPVGDNARAALILVENTNELDTGPRFGQLLEFLAGETALALQAIHDRGELQRAALTDPLTGVANRRAFDRQLADNIHAAETAAAAGATGGDLSLILLDLDGFKALNDRDGHKAGDLLLQACAEAWGGVLRTGDLLARLGGDEFAVVLPSSLDTAASIRGRLEAATPPVVGVSSGIATWTGQSAEAFLAQADQGMYMVKAQGRVRRVVDPRRLDAVLANRERLATHERDLDALAERLRGLLGVPGVFVTLVDSECVTSTGAAARDVQPRLSKIGDSYCRHVVSASAPLIITDASTHPFLNELPGRRDGLAAYAGVPLASPDGQILGAVCAIDSEPREWNAGDLNRLYTAAREVRALLAGASRASAGSGGPKVTSLSRPDRAAAVSRATP